MDRNKFMEIIYKAEERGYKDHLGMLPVLPLSKTSADLLVAQLLWQRRYEIIFSHSFAKAYWGERNGSLLTKSRKRELSKCGFVPDWEFHLQQMVLKKDPFKYLETFL